MKMKLQFTVRTVLSNIIIIFILYTLTDFISKENSKKKRQYNNEPEEDNFQSDISHYGLHGKYGGWEKGLMHKEICQPGEKVQYPCCSEVNRFPDLKFKFYNDQLNNINVAEELCDKIRNKNVTFIGILWKGN